MSAHHCHAKRCSAKCPPRMLMCRSCWALVPPAIQREVYRTVGLRDMRSINETWAPWWRASERAIAEVACAQGVFTREQADAYIAREDAVAAEMEAP